MSDRKTNDNQLNRTPILEIIGERLTVKMIDGSFRYVGFYKGRKLVAQVLVEKMYDGNGNHFDLSGDF